MEVWLVTGAHGFLGSNAGAFLQGRAICVGQARSSTATAAIPRVLGLDLTDSAALTQLIAAVNPDVVLHCAAVSGHEVSAQDPERARAVNVTATQVIAGAAADIGARMVHISTDSVFSGTRGLYSEDDTPEPFSFYGETKLAGEEAVRSTVEDHLIVRTNFFGWSENGRKSVLEFFVNSLRQGIGVRGYPDYVVTSIYAPSLLQAIWDLGQLGAIGTLHLASSDALSKYDFALLVARQFALDADLIARRGPDADTHASSRSRDLSLDTSRAAAILGQPMQSQADGIRQAYYDESVIAGIIRDR